MCAEPFFASLPGPRPLRRRIQREAEAMNEGSDGVVVLTTAPNEMYGAIVVAALEAAGVSTQTTGALTSGFRAEVPGGVQILVRQADLERAQAALKALQDERGDPEGD
jgi:hypothetical protein